MSQPLTDAITALTTYSNTVTGASDTTLSDAVATLAAGYGGGGSIPKLIACKTIVPESNADSSHPLTVQMGTPNTTYYIYWVVAESIPSPDSVLYKALYQLRGNLNSANLNPSAILRPNGTIGTDANLISYNSSTGVLSLGGPYGTFMAGETYYAYLFDLV